MSYTLRKNVATAGLQAEELQAKLTYITEKVPTRIMNTAGSNAGAGSGEFHMYRMVRGCTFAGPATVPACFERL